MKKSLSFLLLSIFSFSVAIAQIKPKVPNWVNSAVFYEIYPQTYYDTDADGIGDLKGIIQKLDYVKSLGVKAIWLNPFYESPFRDAGYDVSDYYKVSARYGTLEDAKTLFAEAHKRDLKVIIDFVPGHTSIDHPWFKESAKKDKNKYSNWYIWTDNTWNDGGNDKGRGMINGFSERNGNFMINFFWHQPALNFGYGNPDTTQKWQLPVNHPDVMALREEMKNILRYWLDLGCDGFRVDMAGSIIRKDKNGEGYKFWQEVKAMLDSKYPEAFMVSEWSYPKDAIKAGFTADYLHWIPSYENLFRKESWRSLNNIPSKGNSFFDKEGKGDISEFMKDYLFHYEATKTNGYISVPVGNHDLSRINVNRTDEELEMIFAFSIAMPGVPFLYYGDEIGMKQLSDYNTLEGNYPPRGGARTPMQWNLTANKGFSNAESNKLWQPVDPALNAPNVQSQSTLSGSLLSKTKKLISLRTTESALAAYADLKVLFAEKNQYPFIISRNNTNETIVAVFNPSSEIKEVTIPISINSKSSLIAGRNVSFEALKTGTKIKVAGVSYGFIKLK
jgi:maltose alpha-D-glucosyltransferase/alpha-amylase